MERIIPNLERSMLDLNDLYFFAQVVERGGFTQASKALAVPKSNLSRRIQRLETTLGVRLIQRTSRRFVVTEVGAEFYEHCRSMAIEAEGAESAVRRRLVEPAGRVRFSCPVALGQNAIADLLPQFVSAFPKVRIVERLTSGMPDLIDEGFDLALRIHAKPLPSSELVQRSVCAIQLIMVASASLLEHTGRPSHPDELKGARGLARDVYAEDAVWELGHDDGQMITVPYEPVFCSNDWLTLRKMAAQGIGIAALPAHVCRSELACGVLERVLPEWRSDHATLSMLMPSRRGALPSVRAFAEFLIRELPRAVAPEGVARR
jgi:DNA-binding transcriptional LysR family regulator